jgi:hypothetical protein
VGLFWEGGVGEGGLLWDVGVGVGVGGGGGDTWMLPG